MKSKRKDNKGHKPAMSDKENSVVLTIRILESEKKDLIFMQKLYKYKTLSRYCRSLLKRVIK